MNHSSCEGKYNVKQSENMMLMMLNNKSSSNAIDKNKISQYPSIFSFNCSEINGSIAAANANNLTSINNDNNNINNDNTNKQIKYRSSTFKAINNLTSSFSHKPQKETKFGKLGAKLKEISSENLIRTICKELKFSNAACNDPLARENTKSSVGNLFTLFSSNISSKTAQTNMATNPNNEVVFNSNSKSQQPIKLSNINGYKK
jgi:hypothetical protein